MTEHNKRTPTNQWDLPKRYATNNFNYAIQTIILLTDKQTYTYRSISTSPMLRPLAAVGGVLTSAESYANRKSTRDFTNTSKNKRLFCLLPFDRNSHDNFRPPKLDGSFWGVIGWTLSHSYWTIHMHTIGLPSTILAQCTSVTNRRTDTVFAFAASAFRLITPQ